MKTDTEAADHRVWIYLDVHELASSSFTARVDQMWWRTCIGLKDNPTRQSDTLLLFNVHNNLSYAYSSWPLALLLWCIVWRSTFYKSHFTNDTYMYHPYSILTNSRQISIIVHHSKLIQNPTEYMSCLFILMESTGNRLPCHITISEWWFTYCFMKWKLNYQLLYISPIGSIHIPSGVVDTSFEFNLTTKSSF